MLKRIISWKYMIAVAIILGCSIYVSHQTIVSKGNFPDWYRLFSWPEGITTWAIILTLMAIAEQTVYTARAAEGGQASAEAAKRAADAAFSQIQAMKDKERARIVVRELDMPEVDHPEGLLDNMQMVVARIRVSNEGASKAFNVRAHGLLTIVPDLEGKSYEVGLRQSISEIIDTSDHESLHYVYVSGMGLSARELGFTAGRGIAFSQEIIKCVRDRVQFLQTSGLITYDDIFGEGHTTPFLFIWQPFGNDSGGQWPDESYWMDLSPPST